jgi:hypothetical protein
MNDAGEMRIYNGLDNLYKGKLPVAPPMNSPWLQARETKKSGPRNNSEATFGYLDFTREKLIVGRLL